MSCSAHYIYYFLLDQPVTVSNVKDSKRKYHQLSKAALRAVLLWGFCVSEANFKMEILIFSSQLRQKMAWDSAQWLLWLPIGWTVSDVIELWSGKKVCGFFLRMLQRTACAEIKLQHHSHICLARVSLTSNNTKLCLTVLNHPFSNFSHTSGLTSFLVAH